MRVFPMRSTLLCCAILLLLAFTFLGTRSLWDPDEGRYTNIALNMIESGDWIHPMRNEHVGHWTKPPLTYWMIAASVATFGYNPWAARMPYALAYLFCAWMVWRIAMRLLPGEENRAVLIYATMLLPFAASQVITTDFLLAAALSGAMAAWVESRYGEPSASRAWVLLMWLGFGLAFLTKGPPGLLPLLTVLAVGLLAPQRSRASVFHWSGLLVFMLVALPWYVVVAADTPGLLEHFLGRELVDRVTASDFGRHAEWYGWLEIYAPTLLVGTMPWTWMLWRWLRTRPSAFRGWLDPELRSKDATGLLLFLWIILPLIVFCLSRSRLPLYLLPLFTPLALVFAAQMRIERRSFPRWPALGLWVAGLLALRLAGAWWPTQQNAGDWAEEIRMRAPHPVREVAFVEDVARYGIHLHLQARVDRVSLEPFRTDSLDPEFDIDIESELADSDDAGTVYVCKEELWPTIRDAIENRGYRVERFGEPYRGRIMFGVVWRAPAVEA